MNDAVIEAISTGIIHRENISFDIIRETFKKDLNRHKELRSGRATLNEPPLLDQYLHSFGKMTKQQWTHFLQKIRIPAERFRLVDYGCGQGLACAILFDHYGNSITEKIDEVILIEPSVVALERAKAIIECYDIGASVKVQCNKLDDLPRAHLEPSGNAVFIHIFSNVLDVDDFKIPSVFKNILRTRGLHYFFAVSNDRDEYGGSPRFFEAESFIFRLSDRGECSVSSSKTDEFVLPNGMKAISWQLVAEV